MIERSIYVIKNRQTHENIGVTPSKLGSEHLAVKAWKNTHRMTKASGETPIIIEEWKSSGNIDFSLANVQLLNCDDLAKFDDTQLAIIRDNITGNVLSCQPVKDLVDRYRFATNTHAINIDETTNLKLHSQHVSDQTSAVQHIINQSSNNYSLEIK